VRPLLCTLLTACVAAGLAAPARGQAVLLDPITRAQGSPSDYVLDLLQDRAGFLWMATDAGIVRYDGRDFRTWTTSEGLPHNYTYALHELSDGRLVVGTYRGAVVLDRGRLERLPDTGESVHAITQDRFGRIYLASSAGLTVCEQRRCRGLLRGGPASEARFVDHPDGSIRLALAGSAVAVLRPGARTVSAERRPAGASSGATLIALTPEGGALLQVRAQGLVLTHDATPGRLRLHAGHARSLTAHPEGGFLLGDENGDVWHIHGRRQTLLLDHADTGGYAVRAFLHDYEGHLWIGLFGGGVRRVVHGALSLPPASEARLHRPMLRLSRDRAGTVWMTTREGLVARGADGRVWQTGKSPLMLATDDGAGGHYVSSSTSLTRRTSAGRWRVLLNDGNWISSLLLGPGDTLWVGTYGSGLRRLARDREVAPPTPGGPPVVEGLVPGVGGAVWALTRSEGAFRYARGRWTNVRAGLPSSAVFSLLDEPDGTLWLGTDRGLVRRRGAAQRVFDDGGRLRGQRLHALFRTGDTLWAVADRQLYGVVGDRLHAFGRARLRPSGDVAIHAAVGVPEQRRVLLGTSAGLVAVDLRALGAPLPPPRVAFLGPVGRPSEAGDTLRLSPGVRSLSLAFAPLTFGSDTPGRLQHRIGGAWSEPTPERTVSLVGLADGWHVLDVRAVNAAGTASDRPVRVVLYVPPPWWRTWPARLAGLVLLVAAVALAARAFFTRRLRRRLRALETERRVQAERDRISRDLHDHVGAQLSGVLAGLELLEGAPAASNGLLTALQREVRETMSALRTAIFTLQHPPDSFDELGRLLERYVRDQARFRAAPTMRCTVEGRFDAPLDPFRALHLFRIAQEGLQNALRHAGAGHVVVRLHGHETHLAVEVEDDGVFRPPDGTGHGLAAMQARAEEIGAALHLDGTPQGTTVRVRWPGEILRTVDVHADAAAVP
jgi:signal transduction histidine kinase/ligand-binding sensor domain-containing protein